MSLLITRFPMSETDFPKIWRVADGKWLDCGPLDQFRPEVEDDRVMAIVAPATAFCSWISLPDLEPRQAEGVAKLRVTNQALGPVHVVAKHYETDILCAAISPDAMNCGIDHLTKYGLDPDIIIPFGLAIEDTAKHVVRAEFDGMTVLRGTGFATPDEPIFRALIAGDNPVVDIDADLLRGMLLDMGQAPLLNLRAGTFAKKARTIWVTDRQRAWIARLTAALLAATILLSLVNLAKYWTATSAENDRALAAARKIDPSIQDIAQAEMQLDRKLQQKGYSKGRFGALSAGLWRAVQSTPNVTAREMRYGNDGILIAVLAAPDANSLNKALVAIQQDGFRVTATPRQDNSGATLVDLTVRMP
jgi:general secretion pathway protein L